MPRRRVQPEAHVRQPEDRRHAGQLGLDAADALDGLDAVAPALLHPGGECQRQRVDEQVGGGQAVAADRQVVDGPGRLQLRLGRAGLAVLVDAGAHDGRAVLAGERQEAVQSGAGAVAVLQVDRVQDRLAADPPEPRLDDRRLRRVEHERQGGLGGEARRHLLHVGGAVPAREVDAHVEDVSALLDLFARHLHARIPVRFEHRLFELPRTVCVRALAHRQIRELLMERHVRVDRRASGLVLRRSHDRRAVVASVPVNRKAPVVGARG